MTTNEAGAAVLGIMFVITNFQGVGKESSMFKVDVGRVIVKTVNWSCWCVLATIVLTFANARVGSDATGHILGIMLGCYLLGSMVTAIMAWINDNPFKNLTRSADKNAQSNADKQVVVEGVKA